MVPALTFENVWQQERPEVREEVSQMWLRAQAFQSYDAAQERAAQLVYVVRNTSGQVVATSTGFKAYVAMLRNHFYAVRMMIDPEFRYPGLASKLMVLTRDHFQAIYTNETVDMCKGVITLVEHDGIREHMRDAVWPASQMVYVGKTKKGYPIRLYYFPGVRI